MENNSYLLLIDGDPIVQSTNKIVLERHGYAVRQASTLA